MANIVPNIGSPNASLSSPLCTPGWPLVSIEQSNPVATVVQKEPPTIHRGTAASPTHEAARAQSGHSADRVI
jgi:hypothetical protein